MADAVASQIILDSSKKTIMKFTNVSDGTGETAVKKVDVSALIGAPSIIKIDRIIYSVNGMTIQLLWDATTDVIAFTVGDGIGVLDFTHFGGLHNNAGTGITGDILLTTSGHTSGDSYSIILEMSK